MSHNFFSSPLTVLKIHFFIVLWDENGFLVTTEQGIGYAPDQVGPEAKHFININYKALFDNEQKNCYKFFVPLSFKSYPRTLVIGWWRHFCLQITKITYRNVKAYYLWKLQSKEIFQLCPVKVIPAVSWFDMVFQDI